MAVGTASRFVVHPGRRADFVEAVRSASEVMGSVGGTVVLRSIQVGGESSGQLSLVIMFADAATRASALDRVRGEGLLSDFAGLMQSDSPPAQVLSRVWLQEVGGPAGVPAPKEVLLTLGLRPNAGQSDTVLAALEEARARHTGLGVEPRAFRIGLGGALTGAFTYGTQHDSLTALATYQEANAALPDPPIGRILRAGAAELLGSSLGYLIDL